LNAPALVPAFGFVFRIAPVIPNNPGTHTLNQPVRPAGTNWSKRGVVRGVLLVIELRNWQAPAARLKLTPVSESS
jgi:hypothetical protein